MCKQKSRFTAASRRFGMTEIYDGGEVIFNCRISFTVCKLIDFVRTSRKIHFTFSNAFHKEVTSSTVSSQRGGEFLLRGETVCLRVGSSKA